MHQCPYLLLTAPCGRRLLPKAALPGCSWAVSFRAGGSLAKNLLHHRPASIEHTKRFTLAKSDCQSTARVSTSSNLWCLLSRNGVHQSHTGISNNVVAPCLSGWLSWEHCLTTLWQACLHAAAALPGQSGGGAGSHSTSASHLLSSCICSPVILAQLLQHTRLLAGRHSLYLGGPLIVVRWNLLPIVSDARPGACRAAAVGKPCRHCSMRCSISSASAVVSSHSLPSSSSSKSLQAEARPFGNAPCCRLV